jgi:hypothetical protein
VKLTDHLLWLVAALDMSWCVPRRGRLPLNNSLIASRLSKLQLEWTPSCRRGDIGSVSRSSGSRLDWGSRWRRLRITPIDVILLLHKDGLTDMSIICMLKYRRCTWHSLIESHLTSLNNMISFKFKYMISLRM